MIEVSSRNPRESYKYKVQLLIENTILLFASIQSHAFLSVSLSPDGSRLQKAKSMGPERLRIWLSVSLCSTVPLSGLLKREPSTHTSTTIRKPTFILALLTCLSKTNWFSKTATYYYFFLITHWYCAVRS